MYIQIKLLHPFPSDLLENTINKTTKKEVEIALKLIQIVKQLL